MYVTRRLSQLLASPDSIAAAPPGPNSGYLVILDEEAQDYSCFGLCKNRSLKQLPFPQNKELTVQYTTSTGDGTNTQLDRVLLIPVLNQPLSSNRYYAVNPHGKRIGEAFTCSSEDDKVTCCFCRCIKDVKSRPLDPCNVYQQIEIVPYSGLCASKGSYYANSVASDGFPPLFLRRKAWTIFTKSAENCKLDVAEGLNSRTRGQLPEFSFSLPQKFSESLTVGKWYCPFMFVKEGTLRDQVKKSMYYEITLEQRWEQIFTCNSRDSHHNRGNGVAIDALIEKEEAFIDGINAVWNEIEGVVWFAAAKGGVQKSVGLRVETVQRMKWEEERFGYASGGAHERQVMINKVEEYNGKGEWNEFGSYVLVERFNLKRQDGSLVMSYDFKHLDKVKNKWE